ncbi:MAG: flippase-like domain-containing protein [Ruminococcus sp.]|nr:flippase-like domain-containing protein [Ruminococcus sp.]
MKKAVFYTANVLFIAAAAVLTGKLLLKNSELSDLAADLAGANKLWLALGALLAFCFVAGESVVIKYMLWLFRVKLPFRRCLKYSFIGFFYSCITPSASGGQPAQLYYMKKDGIGLGHSTLIMLMVTIAYKSVLVIFGLVFYILGHSFVAEHIGSWSWLLMLGFVLNIAYITVLMLLFFSPRKMGRIAARLISLLCRLRILKDKKKPAYAKRIDRMVETYSEGSGYIRTHIKAVINIFVVTAVQRMCFFAVTWAVYRSCGLTGTGFFGIVTIQTMIAVSVEMLPLPGAAGITEACFIMMFGGIFTEEYVRAGLLMSRGLTFYMVLLAGAGVTLAAHIITMKKTAPPAAEIKKDRMKAA